MSASAGKGPSVPLEFSSYPPRYSVIALTPATCINPARFLPTSQPVPPASNASLLLPVPSLLVRSKISFKTGASCSHSLSAAFPFDPLDPLALPRPPTSNSDTIALPAPPLQPPALTERPGPNPKPLNNKRLLSPSPTEHSPTPSYHFLLLIVCLTSLGAPPRLVLPVAIPVTIRTASRLSLREPSGLCVFGVAEGRQEHTDRPAVCLHSWLPI
ncbi:hypothetical protein BT67DRAFT_69588 [Trichocladium antarcticum]|uniref:Uncharacterized protein n=1 Tax=Trichocladium antarcticum TaxID=1450529 RepID=A0AAN6ZBK7_9PEZI|nr:hypothetical protein BT67DRAFT_69588 [Trichocladium antarcticum]